MADSCPCSGLSTHIVAHNRNCEQGYDVLFTRPSLARAILSHYATRNAFTCPARALAATRPCATPVTLEELLGPIRVGIDEFSADEGQGINEKERLRYDDRRRTAEPRLVAQVIRPSSRVQHSKYHLK